MVHNFSIHFKFILTIKYIKQITTTRNEIMLMIYPDELQFCYSANV